MGGVTIVYVTHRQTPRFDWFADSLSAQLEPADAPEVVFVDGLYSAERSAALEQVVRGRFPFAHVPPKPTPWCGPHRLTRHDYFSAASARNTGIVHANTPYVVFADDCSVLAPGWWRQARTAARRGYVIAGAYWKRRGMVVEEGVVLAGSEELTDRDTRWEQGADGLVRIGGGQLFGCSFGVPRDLLVAVNGLDELCDPIGGEDYHLGIRLEWAGAHIFYSRAMMTMESADPSHGPVPPRADTLLDPAAYMARLREFGVERRSTSGRHDGSHMILDIAFGTRSPRSVGNYYDLATLTPAGLEGTIEALPSDYWLDGTPLDEL